MAKSQWFLLPSHKISPTRKSQTKPPHPACDRLLTATGSIASTGELKGSWPSGPVANVHKPPRETLAMFRCLDGPNVFAGNQSDRLLERYPTFVSEKSEFAGQNLMLLNIPIFADVDSSFALKKMRQNDVRKWVFRGLLLKIHLKRFAR